MEHLAIMRKSWGLLPKILSGEKIIESRWYRTKYPPWNDIQAGDTVYFKNSGEPVSLKARVARVIQFENLNQERVRDILTQYGQLDGIGIEDIPKFYELFRDKKYCILVFLANPVNVNPFDIDKRGFGAMAAWICVKDINLIKEKLFK